MKMTSLTSRRGHRYIGPMPDDLVPGVQVRCRKIPSEAWYAAHPDGATEPPGDEDMVIQVVIITAAVTTRLRLMNGGRACQCSNDE